MVWSTPGNDTIYFREGDRGNEFVSGDGQWKAKVSRLRQVIRNQEGWQYTYAKGRLTEVRSPGMRILEFKWDRKLLLGIQLRDGAGNTRIPVLSAVYDTNDCLSALKLVETQQFFKYHQRGSKELIALWKPVTGEPMKFRYHPDTDVLQGIGKGDTKEIDNIEIIKTVYVKPTKEQNAAQKIAAKRNPLNYWLEKDLFGTYVYGRKGKGNKEWDSSVITITATDGSEAKADFSAQRGVMTSKQGGMERKEYYYRSPGQRYDGKLRRVTLGKKVIEEYRYDRRTDYSPSGLTRVEKSRFYDYDPKARARKCDWEPKPVRIRQGTRKALQSHRRNTNMMKDGKLTIAKDSLGRVTSTPTPHAEICGPCRNSAGDELSYEYDGLGRMIASEVRADALR